MLAKTTYWCLVGNEGMIHNPSNPQQPIHSLRLAPVGLKPHFSWRNHRSTGTSPGPRLFAERCCLPDLPPESWSSAGAFGGIF